MNRRIDDLFTYLNLLEKLNSSEPGYHCNAEISECIIEIRRELEIGAEKPTYDMEAVGRRDIANMFDLTAVSTAQLTDELAKREGVEEYVLEHPGSHANLRVATISKGYTEIIEGPARIIVNKD